MPDATELLALYERLNARCFDATLPPCRLRWSRQLTRAAGNINVRERLIKLSVPLLCDAYARCGDGYEVCGVPCETPDAALEEVLKHEMIHLWLHERGLPSGHTREFRCKARQLGQPKTRHGIVLPAPQSGWVYLCPACEARVHRRRRFGRRVACARCCAAHNDGQFAARFQLRGHRVGALGVPASR